MEIKCPITNEVILRITPNGIVQRVNYCEVWFKLSDGSRMRVAMSKNAKKNLKQAQSDELFSSIRNTRLNKIRGKSLPKEVKERQLARVEKCKYTELIDRSKSLIKVKKI